MVRVESILDLLVSRSCAPSTFGAQLDRLRYGLSNTPDPFRAREDAEANMMEKAGVMRCLSAFSERGEFRTKTISYKGLERVQKATYAKLPQGHIAQEVLRAYQEWVGMGQERALAMVYGYLNRVVPELAPEKASLDLVQSFRDGKAKRARDFAAELYADSLLALEAFVRVYNRA